MAQTPEPEKSRVSKVVSVVAAWPAPGPGPAPPPWAVATAGVKQNKAATQAANSDVVSILDIQPSFSRAEGHRKETYCALPQKMMLRNEKINDP